MKCWVQSIQMRRSRALIHPALLAPDGMSGEVRQWRDLSFLLRLYPFFMCDSLGAYSRRRTILTSRHLVVLLHFIVLRGWSWGLRSQEKQALKIVRFQRHLPLTIQFYISCRISGVPPLQSDFSGLSSALKDDTNEPKKRKEARTKPTKMARKKSTLRMTRTTTDKLTN